MHEVGVAACVTRVGTCSYHQSLSQHMTDDELDVLKSFRVPGRILFVRASKLARKQPYASPPPSLPPSCL